MKYFWFYIESYVYISIRKNKVLLYNTIDGNILENDQIEIVKICHRLIKKTNFQVIRLAQKDLSMRTLKFISEIKELFMGDILEWEKSKIKPIQMIPYLKIHNDIYRILSSETNLERNHILRNLFDITLYLDNKCNQKECIICKYAYRQFTCCTKNPIANLNLKSVIDLINKLNQLQITLNLVGSEASLITILDSLNTLKYSYLSFIWHVHLKNLSTNLSSIMNVPNFKINILISDLSTSEIITRISKIVDIKQNLKFSFVIYDFETYKQALYIKDKLTNDNSKFYVLYNEYNLDFIKKNVFCDKDDIIENKSSYKEVLVNNVLNKNFFGKLILAGTDQYFTSFFGPTLGTLKDDIRNVLLNEFKKNTSWRLLRKDKMPCKFCNYALLCPPISNLERSINKYDLCNINKLSY